MRRCLASLLGNGGPEGPGARGLHEQRPSLETKMCSRCSWIPCEARSWAWVGTSAPECPGPGSKTGSETWRTGALWNLGFGTAMRACGEQLLDSGRFAGPQGGLTRGKPGELLLRKSQPLRAQEGILVHKHLEFCGRGCPCRTPAVAQVCSVLYSSCLFEVKL